MKSYLLIKVQGRVRIGAKSLDGFLQPTGVHLVLIDQVACHISQSILIHSINEVFEAKPPNKGQPLNNGQRALSRLKAKGNIVM